MRTRALEARRRDRAVARTEHGPARQTASAARGVGNRADRRSARACARSQNVTWMSTRRFLARSRGGTSPGSRAARLAAAVHVDVGSARRSRRARGRRSARGRGRAWCCRSTDALLDRRGVGVADHLRLRAGRRDLQAVGDRLEGLGERRRRPSACRSRSGRRRSAARAPSSPRWSALTPRARSVSAKRAASPLAGRHHRPRAPARSSRRQGGIIRGAGRAPPRLAGLALGVERAALAAQAVTLSSTR